MDYWGSITVPANTGIASPVREVVGVCPGVIRHVWLFFPPGHRGKAKTRVLRFQSQIWPTNIDAWYLGDGTVIEFDENYPLLGSPYELYVEGYNTSLDHPHTTYLRFTVMPEEEVTTPTILVPRRVL